jgi:uncharacterized protein
MSQFRDMIQQSVKNAMLTKDYAKLETLRAINGALVNAEKDAKGKPVDAMTVVAALAKQRQQSIDAYTNAGRLEHAAKEQAELDILNSYLPKKLTDAEIDAIVKDMVENEFAGMTMKDQGKVINAFKDRYPAQNTVVVIACIKKYVK